MKKLKLFMRRIFFLFLLLTVSGIIQAQDMDVQHYKYEIELSDNSDAINGRAFITVKFLAEAPIVQLDLVSGEEGKGMYVFQVKENNQLLSSSHKNNVVVINLQKPAKAGETRTFEISYMGTPADGLIISRNKYGDRTFFSDNWPNRAHHWIPCQDVPSDKASVEFIVTAPSHYRVISNGLLKEEKEAGNNRRRTHWVEVLPIPTKVMVIGVADFAVARVDSAYRIPVTAWVYRQDSSKGFYDYALADDILEFFESYVGPYPYQKLANVQSRTIFGGMENANAIFYAENSVTGTRRSEALMAHEIAHQWFGNSATEKSFVHLWLSEGFATYLADLYIEQKYGVDSFQKRLQEEREEVLGFVKKTSRPVVDSTSAYMDLLNANSYQKGAWTLHMLRSEVGDSSFKKIIRTYYQQYKFGNAVTRDFEKVAEAVSGRDLKWFFDQWLHRPGVPELVIESKIDGGEAKGKIVQTSGTYRLPLEIGVVLSDGSMVKEKILLQEKETEFKFKMAGMKTIVIDPDKKLLYSEVQK